MMKPKTILCRERFPLRMAFDSAESLGSSGASKPHLTGEAYEMMTKFLVRVLDSDTYREVERQLGELLDQQDAASRPTAPAAGAAADRRPRVAADAGSIEGFYGRFPSAKRIGAA